MNRLSLPERCAVMSCLIEGTSQRATVRITGINKKTVAKLAVELGEACERFADRVMVNLAPCQGDGFLFVAALDTRVRQRDGRGC